MRFFVCMVVHVWHPMPLKSSFSLSHPPVYPAVNYTDWLAEPSETLEIKSLTWMCHSIFILKPKDNSKNYREFNYTQVFDWSLAPVFIINQFTVFSFICKGNLPVIKLTASVNSLITALIIVKYGIVGSAVLNLIKWAQSVTREKRWENVTFRGCFEPKSRCLHSLGSLTAANQSQYNSCNQF